MGDKGYRKFLILWLCLGFAVVIFTSFAIAANCWTYTSSTDCTSANGCNWRNDSWGTWCEELSCWSLKNQSSCTTVSITGKNCTWAVGLTSYSCEQISCWGYSGTNQTQCESNPSNKSCTWSSSCYSAGGEGCWGITNENTCKNKTGCAWGSCFEKGCSSYSSQSTCNAGRDWKGNNCTWSSSSSYCKENNCWDSTLYPNKTVCEGATGLSCEWAYNSCQEKGCWSFDFTNATACVNNSIGKACTWSGSYCNADGCWNANTQNSCEAKTGCRWSSWTSSSWCEEVSCYTWDSYKGGNKTQCESNTYGLNCIWTGNPPGNQTTGWCYKDVALTKCANITTEKACYDSFYCWWKANDWTDSSKGGNCTDPTWGTGDFSNINGSILNDWNPGCYIFDLNSTKCNQVFGCNYTGGICDGVSGSTGSYGSNITSTGIKCSYINDSGLCNNIASLSNCCTWQNASCSENRQERTCFTQLDQTPNGEKACEDAEIKGDCDTIAGDPWYMPCKWNNSTDKCEFKSSSVFGNASKSLVKIENQRNCEAAGGKWITENYCEGSVSVPSGRCEYKFDDEDNCNKACFACENKDSNGNLINITNAETACLGSKLGYCEFIADTTAPNKIGFCKTKEQFKKGLAVNCNSVCGDCAFLGNPKGNSSMDSSGKCLTPSCYCAESKANSDGGGCKWITDNSTFTGGYCLEKGDKTCLDSCDRCKERDDCANLGRSALNSSGSCKWQGSDNDGSCVANVAGDVEICWDGIDNNDDKLVDCADPSCYADSWCGFVSGDCFGWTDNTTCINNKCEWVNDTWNPKGWCDYKGSSCWKLDENETECGTNSNCNWNNGTGSGWCQRDWSIAEKCFVADNETHCSSITSCSWTNDTWCDGNGATSDWCKSKGGWCDHTDFKPKDCWQKYSNATCSTTSGCAWKVDQWSKPLCEVNWSSNCWQQSSNASCTSAGCLWKNETWGSTNSAWCTNKFDECWSKSTQIACAAVTSVTCNWRSYGSSSGTCEPACFNATTSSSCTAVSGCIWKEGGWCEEQQSQTCYNSSNNNEANCKGTAGCEWDSPGWCDPKGGGFSGGAISGGGGVGGSFGADCFKYDGNKTLCTNNTIINISCGWFPAANPVCEVDWSTNCWKYTSSAGGCNATNGCWWFNDTVSGGTVGWCMNVMDQCWSNTTLQSNATACNANAYCNATAYGCAPTCFNASSQSACGALSGCKWSTGWCNPSGMNDLFDTIEAGAPVPIAIDNCGPSSGESNTQQSVDICGIGMKDMGEGFGFGANVWDFSNASVCNKEKISSNVIEKFGTAIAGSEKTGNGNESVTFFVYLDTDGNTAEGCKLSHNESATGYEFRFRYASEWNASKQKAVETFNAYRCENAKWMASDIKLSAWKKLMCSEIGGPMIGVEKSELSRFPSLYNATKDIRVYVATIGITGNVSSPSDIAGPGYVTPGAIDFEIVSCFDYGADGTKFEDILKNGFVQYEDCFDNKDNDNDGNSDCNDWDCQFSSTCTGKGVNAANYTDTQTPQVVGVKVEEYPDAALVMYDTNKPANGTLEFYGNDSRCLTINKTILDIGVTSTNVRDYKLWHTAEIYETTLGYALTNQTKYYYKLKACDNNNKCAISKCTSFVTEQKDRCGICNFVTRIKVPSGWDISYDVGLDGTYEHMQGQVCGTNAGMKTNYTLGRRVNIKLNKTDGTTYFEFINASLTKTGLNDKVRTISTTGDIIGTSTLVGLTAETRDKIINSLHPEICRVKIPFTGTCNQLFHCDDSGANCIDRTSSATLLNSTNCVWQVPFCEFSTYRESTSTSGSSDSGSSSGGGGSGGGILTKKNETAETSESSQDKGTEQKGEEESEQGSDKKEEIKNIPEEEEKTWKSTVLWIVLGIAIAGIIIGGVIYLGMRKSRKGSFRY